MVFINKIMISLYHNYGSWMASKLIMKMVSDDYSIDGSRMESVS